LSNICENVRWSLKFISDKGFIFGDVYYRRCSPATHGRMAAPCAALSGKLSGFDIFWERYPHKREDIEARCQM